MASAATRDGNPDDDHPDRRPLSVARSRTSVPDDSNRPLSLVSTSSYTPQIIAAARERQRSLATEILGPNHSLVFPSPEPSEADGPDLVRLSKVSELSEPAFLPTNDAFMKALPSPLAAHPPRSGSPLPKFDKSIKKSISSPIVVSDSLGFASKGQNRTVTPSMKGITSPRVSMFIEDLEGMVDGSNRPATSAEARKNGPAPVGWPLTASNASPAPESHLDESSGLAPPETHSTNTEPRKRVVSHTTVVSPQARKGSSLNFLPKFLRAKSPEIGKAGPVVGDIKTTNKAEERHVAKLEEHSPHREAVSPKSFFDDESSDSGDESQIESAQQAVVASPVMVKHGSATKVGLKEMLRSTPPAEDASSGEQTVKLLQDRTNDPNPVAGSSKNGPSGVGLWKEMNPFTSTTHKSEHSAQTSLPPPQPMTSRKVSFPPPAPLDIQPGHLFLRQSIISTPYPSDSDEHRKETEFKNANLVPQEGHSDPALETVLTLVIHGNGTTIPKIKRIAIPSTPQLSSLVSPSEKNAPPTKATLTFPVDDEYLFKLIRKEYTSMRGGILKRLLSARTVHSVALHAYTSTSQLLTTMPSDLNLNLENESQTPKAPSPLSLFHNPKHGRAQRTYITTIRSQSHPTTTTSPTLNLTTSFALHIHTSLSPTPLLLSLLLTLLLSILTTLLWVFLGVAPHPYPHSPSHSPGTTLNITDVFGASAQVSQPGGGAGWVGGDGGGGYRGAGARMGSGALLGMLVLGLGWTGVAGWAVMSWLVV